MASCCGLMIAWTLRDKKKMEAEFIDPRSARKSHTLKN
jgi:hypothetical protein